MGATGGVRAEMRPRARFESPFLFLRAVQWFKLQSGFHALSKRFRYLDTEWEAVSSGVSTGAWFGDAHAPLTNHGVVFRSQWGEFRGSVERPDTEAMPDEELRIALARELSRRVLRGIEQSQYVWRTAEALSKETGIPVEHVRVILESSSDAEVMRAPYPNKQGHLLYTTREHYRRLTPFLQRYAGIVRESS